MKVIVIGLDGAGFELIDPWISEGRLPNLAKIKQNGVWADMESVLPPVTSPNWKCYSTGKNPGKVGIFWWENIDWKNREVYYPAGRKLENKELWDYIGEAGMKVGVLGMPTTYPPKKVNGFLVAGGETEDTNFTYPRELEKELKKQGWKNHPITFFDVDKHKWSQEIHEIADMGFNTAHELAAKYKPDFLQATCFYINSLHHFLWDSPETRTAWEIADKHIGEFMKQGCDLMIMSDHGSNKITQVFNINAWLEQEGYLKLKPNLASVLYRLGITQQKLLTILSKLKLLRLAWKVVPKRLYTEIPNATGEVMKEAKTSKINWRKSRALASGQGPIYLNPRNGNNDKLKEEIKHKLEALVSPSTGNRIIEKVYAKEEIYHGKYLNEAPDLIIDQAKGVHIPGGIGQRDIFDFPQKWQAENKKFGLFMAYGPSIEPRGRVSSVSILDLAPTILHLMNIPIPEHMDGRVLKEIFREGSKQAKHRETYQREDDKKKIEDKIRHLRNSGRL